MRTFLSFLSIAQAAARQEAKGRAVFARYMGAPDFGGGLNRDDPANWIVTVVVRSRGGVEKKRTVAQGDYRPVALAIVDLGAEFDAEEYAARFYELPAKHLLELANHSPNLGALPATVAADESRVAQPPTWHDLPPML
jgi:hypothetical protein